MFDVKKELNKWLSDKGISRYIDEVEVQKSFEEHIVFPTPAIQQDEKEISEFIDYLQNEVGKQKKVLEIGLGYFGSTHFIFRHFFEQVITIEKEFDRVRAFVDNLYKYYDNNLDVEQSRFIHGFSYEPSTIYDISKLLDGKLVDMLFIDGHHTYESILSDFLIYKNFLRKDGYLVMHDYLWPFKDYEIKRFIDSLENEYDMKKIIHSKEQGIVILRRKK